MASNCYAADSYSKYSLYFDMLELKISKKGIEPECHGTGRHREIGARDRYIHYGQQPGTGRLVDRT